MIDPAPTSPAGSGSSTRGSWLRRSTTAARPDVPTASRGRMAVASPLVAAGAGGGFLDCGLPMSQAAGILTAMMLTANMNQAVKASVGPFLAVGVPDRGFFMPILRQPWPSAS